MANHISALKRIRQTATKRLLNKYKSKTTRNAVRDLKGLEDRKEAEVLLPKVTSMLDKLAKSNIIHNNKAANLKSKLTKHVNSLTKTK
ncbi:MAG: 30S ribosomal protein S20, partial [Flavobacteriales bacterium]